MLGTKAGRLVAAEFADPARLAALEVTRFIRFAAARDLVVRRVLAERLVTADADALPTGDAAVARQVLAADLALLADLDTQVAARRRRAGPAAARQPVRDLDHCAGLGHGPRRGLRRRTGRPRPGPGPGPALPRRRPVPGCSTSRPGERRDGAISREGSVELRRALIDLGIGLWLCDTPARTRAAALRGKHGGVIACVLAHRANRIAFALVRDQARYDPSRWTTSKD